MENEINTSEEPDSTEQTEILAVAEPEKRAPTAGAFIKSILKYSVAPVISFVLGFLSVIVLTRLLSTEQYGLVNLFASTTSVFAVFLCLGLDSGILRFFNEPPDGLTKKDIIFKSFIYPLMVAVVLALVTIPFYGSIAFLLFSKYSYVIMLAFVLNAIGTLISRYYLVVYRIQDSAKKYTIISVITIAVPKIATVLLAFLMPADEIILLVLGICCFAVGILYLIFDKKAISPEKGSLRKKLSLKNYSPISKYSLILWPTAIFAVINPYITMTILTNILGLGATGIYNSSNSFSSIITVFQTGFATYWATYMYAHYKTEQKNIKRVQVFVLLFTIVLFSGILLFKDVLYLAIGNNYKQTIQYFSFCLLAPIFYIITETSSYGCTLAKKTHISLIISGVTVLINLGLCILLTYLMGIAGACIATGVSGLMNFIMQSFFSQKYYKSIGSYKNTVYTCIALIALAVTCYFLYNNILIMTLVVLAICVVTAIVFRAEFVTIFQYIKRFLAKRKNKN